MSRLEPTMATCLRCAARVPWWAFFGNLALTIYKVVVGYLGSSPALIADGLHSLTDVVGTSVILVSTRISSREPDARHPFGYGKVEFLSSMFIYVVLIAIALFIFVGGLLILINGHYHRPHLVTFFAGLVSVIYNVIMFRLGQCAGKRTNSAALLANSFENRADGISSAAVCIGILLAILIHPAADPLAAMIVGIIIFINAIHEMKTAIGGLMDRSVPGTVLDKIRRFVSGQADVEDVDYVRVRSTGNGYWVDLGIAVAPGMSAVAARSLADDVRDALYRRSKRLDVVEVYVSPHEPETGSGSSNGTHDKSRDHSVHDSDSGGNGTDE